AEMSRHVLPPLKQKPSDYIRGPQYFQSIQIYEGEQSLRHAFESLGEDTLMFATDYPHSESWFPKSAEIVLGWTSLAEGARRRLFHRAFVPSTAMRSGARSIDSVSSSRAAPRGSGSLVNQTAAIDASTTIGPLANVYGVARSRTRPPRRRAVERAVTGPGLP